MVRKISLSQFKSQLRQAQQKRQQAVAKINRAISNYNSAARAHNARVRANQQKIRNELARLTRQTSRPTRMVSYRTSVQVMHTAYTTIERREAARHFDDSYARILDLSEREAANSLAAANSLLDPDGPAAEPSEEVEDGELRDKLRIVSPELDDRWRGAVYSLNASNPDAARHFCTSAREIMTSILEITAPDASVFAAFPECQKTERGNATRRSKIRFLLHRKGMVDLDVEDFVTKDIDNVVELFDVFNKGTHGSAGAFTLEQLSSVRIRVEDGITFLTEIASLN